MSRQWSPARKAETRRRNLRKRIEKKHGYDPESQQLTLEILESEQQKAINAEFTQECEKNPDYYYEGKPPDTSHLPDPESMDTYNSSRLWHDLEYRRHWEKKLNMKFTD